MKTLSFVAGTLLVAALAAPVAAQTTGTRIKGNTEQPVSIIRFEEPAEIALARSLIARGEIDAAIETVEGLLAQDSAPDIQYFGHNALCVAHSAGKNWDEALKACDQAVAIRSGHWMALNSRGTVHLMAGRISAAIADYEAALASLSENANARQVVEHNLELARNAREAPVG